MTALPAPRIIHTIEDVKKSKAFCLKPWNHLHISIFGKVAPCCLASIDDTYSLGDINEESFEQIWNGEKMRQFRLDMLQDKPNFRCHQCYTQEKMGLNSPRTFTNAGFMHHLPWALATKPDGTSLTAKPVTWDIRISNLCNFKCRICSHHSSSRWFKDAKALGFERPQNESVWFDKSVNRGPKDFDLLMRQIEFVIPELEEIYFAGGEPLVMDEHYLMLRKLIETGKTKVRLRYNTNFSRLVHKGINVLDLWQQFENTAVYASLDDSGERGEFQRTGISWQKAEANRIEMLQKCPNTEFAVSATVSVFNLQHLPDYHRNWVERGFIKLNEFYTHILMNPPQYSITILPQKIKARAEQKILEHLEWIKHYASLHPEKISSPTYLAFIESELKGVLTYMNSKDDTHLIPRFIDISQKLDAMRHENTASVFPELKELWEQTSA